jgi:MFS family permease
VRGDGHAGSVTGFVLAVAAFFVAMVGTTLPTPLYPLYEERYSFGPLLVTVIFAIYAFGVIGGLILFGNLSDRVGRKPVLLLGLVLSAASALLFLLAGSLAPICRPESSPGLLRLT